MALSAQLYGDASLRGARDIDLLVDPDRMAQADVVLIEAGYRRAVGALSPRQSAAYRRWIKEFQYIHVASGASVELHHRLCDNPHLLAWDFDTLWGERDEVRVGETVLTTLPRRRLALYLCVHGAGHAWERLRWLVDLAVLLREPGSVDAAVEPVLCRTYPKAIPASPTRINAFQDHSYCGPCSSAKAMAASKIPSPTPTVRRSKG